MVHAAKITEAMTKSVVADGPRPARERPGAGRRVLAVPAERERPDAVVRWREVAARVVPERDEAERDEARVDGLPEAAEREDDARDCDPRFAVVRPAFADARFCVFAAAMLCNRSTTRPARPVRRKHAPPTR
jgi:hypothetical protein